MFWCCCVFVHSRNPSLEVRVEVPVWSEAQQVLSVPWGTLLAWGGVEGQSFPLHWVHSLPSKISSKSEGSANKLLYKVFFSMDGELLWKLWN